MKSDATKNRTLALQCGALLLGFNLLAGQIGCLSAPVRDYAALVLCLPVLVVRLKSAFAAAGWIQRGLALVLLIPVLYTFCAGGVHAIFGVLLGLLLPLILRGKKGEPAPEQHLLMLLTAGVGLWLIAQQVFPLAFVGLDKLSSITCAVSSLLARSVIQFGPSQAGLSVTLFFLMAHVAVFAVSRPREAWRLFSLVAGQLMLLLAYQVLFHHWLSHWRLDSPWVSGGTAELVLFLAGSFLVVFHLCQAARAPVNCRLPTGKMAGLAVASICLFVSFSDGFWALFQPQVQPKVLLYDDGTLDWSVPQYGRYSGRAGGMFGSLGPFLQRHNYQATRGALTNGALEQANILVVFNLGHKFSAEEKRRIWDFVAAGGGLLAVGDHTGTTAIREPFNDLLAPANIRFNFDCAMPRRMLWAEGLESFQHYITCGLDSAADTQISVGASLSIGWPARPVLVGQHGFSDKGDLQNAAMGYLGDRQYSNDERLGDVVLVADANYKRGKVLVFGDTTSFQNGALALSGDFVRAIFHWLPMPALRAVKMLSWVCLSFAVALLWAGIGATASWPVAWMSLFVCSYLGYATSAQVGRHCSRPAAAAPDGKEALVDASHLSRCDQDLWLPDGLGGLVQNLMRKNYLPVVTRRFSPELLRQSRLVFLVAPAKPLQPYELSAYESFVREGGNLYIAVGYEDAAACRELLQRFGLQLRNLPLGPLGPEANEANQEGRVMQSSVGQEHVVDPRRSEDSAAPPAPTLPESSRGLGTNSAAIYFVNAWPVQSDSKATEVLYQRNEYPLIVCRRCGRGKVFLFGDSVFFLNRNLEMPESFNRENIEFLRKLIPDHE